MLETFTPNQCFYYLSLNFAPKIREFIDKGKIICPDTMFCDAKTPITIYPSENPVNIRCTFPNCPLEATNKNKQYLP